MLSKGRVMGRRNAVASDVDRTTAAILSMARTPETGVLDAADYGRRARPSYAGSDRRSTMVAASKSIYQRCGKRVFDVMAAGCILALCVPLLAVLMGVVALDGGRPVFAHRRVGFGGQTFGCLKLRTMVVDAEQRLGRLLAEDQALAAQWARDHKLDPDPRVTAFGDFLRRSSLDELMQLVNVLRGEMSLVGPRPVTPAEMERYGDSAAAYQSVRPGITGLWQVSGRNDLSYEERIALDVRYARNVGFLSDLSIVVRTFQAVMFCTGK